MNISLLKCLDQSGKIVKNVSIDSVLNTIKSHPKAELIEKCKSHPQYGGKYNDQLVFNDNVWQYGKFEQIKRNYYQHVKSVELPAVTWNATFKGRRKKDNVDQLSGYIYCDVDNFYDLIEDDKYKVSNLDEAKAYVQKILESKNFPFIKASWKSLSGDGFGFLVSVEDLTFENFKSTWISIKDLFKSKGVFLDEKTKDITRPNVISYDPEIFIRDDKDVKPYMAVDPIQRNVVKVRGVDAPDEIIQDMLEGILGIMYNKEEYWGSSGLDYRLNYKFYWSFFIFCNKKGIPLQQGLNYLASNTEKYPMLFSYRDYSDVERMFVDQIENQYAHEFGEDAYEFDEEEKLIYSFDIYQPYSKDPVKKLKLLWNNLSKKGYSFDKSVKSIAYVAKNSGILRSVLTKFLSDQYNLSTIQLNSIKWVYNDWNIPFGLVKTPTEEYIEQLKNEYIAKKESEGHIVTQRKSYEGKVDAKLQGFVDSSQNIFGDLSLDNYIDILWYIASKSKGFAISRDSVISHLKSYEQITNDSELFDEVNRMVEFIINECYEYQPWKFGLNFTKKVSLDQVKSSYNITKEIFLEDGQYLSDIDLDFNNNTIIWADTGTGKTTWICSRNEAYRLILVPITGLLKGIWKKYNASVYFNDKKDVKEGDKLIVCTYSSFPNLLRIMQKWENVKVCDYELHFDEFHNNAVASSKEFRGYELNVVLDSLHLFKQQQHYTGTMFPILHPTLSKYDIVRVKRKNNPVKEFKRVLYSDILYSVEKKLSKEGKNIIYLQNKKEEGMLGELLDYLELNGWDRNNIWTINADKKDSAEFEKLINNEAVDDNVQILICTSVVVEGININNPDFKTVHFMSHEGVINMEQMVNRLRNIFTRISDNRCMIYLYKKYSEDIIEETDQINVVEIQKELISLANASLNVFSKSYKSEDSLSKKVAFKLFNQNIFGKSRLFRNRDGQMIVDYLSIANMAYRKEKAYAYNDIKFVEQMLSEYNWVYAGDEMIFEGKTSQQHDMLKISGQAKKDELLDGIREIIEDIRGEGEKKCIMSIDDDNISELEVKQHPKFQIALRSKIKYLVSCMDFKDACNLLEDWVFDKNMSDRVWSKIKRQINVQIARYLDIYQDGVDMSTDFSKSMVDYYLYKKKREETKKQYLTANEIVKIVANRVKKFGEYKNQQITESFALSLFKRYFDLSKVLINNTVKYHIDGLKIKNDVVNFTVEFEKWAKRVKESEGKFTTDELADVINNLRSKSPILSMYKLNSRDALKLAHDYFEIPKVSKRKIGKKRVNTYQVISLFPEELKNVTVKPLRNIDLLNKHYDDMNESEKRKYDEYMRISLLTYHISMKNDEDLVHLK